MMSDALAVMLLSICQLELVRATLLGTPVHQVFITIIETSLSSDIIGSNVRRGLIISQWLWGEQQHVQRFNPHGCRCESNAVTK